MPQQPFTSPHKVSKGISLGRVFCNDGAENVDFVTHQASVGFGKRVRLIAANCGFNTPFPTPDFSTGFNNPVQRFGVGSHSTTLTHERRKRYE